MKTTLQRERVSELTEVLRRRDSFISKQTLLLLLLTLMACERQVEFVGRWSQDQSIYYQEYHLNNKLHGIQKLYDSNLHMFRSYTYESGILNGPSVSYSKEGDTLEFCNFVNGEVEGEFLIFSATGVIVEKNLFSQGELNGTSIRYFENGMIKDSGTYDMGVKRGLWCSYDSLHLSKSCEVKTGLFPD